MEFLTSPFQSNNTLGGPDSTLTKSQIDATNLVSSIMSGFSIAGSLFIILCYFYFKDLRKFSFKLVAILSATDLLNQIFDFIGPSGSEIVRMISDGTVSKSCYVQAIGNSIFELSSVMWTTAIAATLYMFVFWRMPGEVVESKFRWYIVACVLVPIILAMLPLSNDSYGPAGAWCWIRSGPEKAYWEFIIFYGPLWIAILFNTYVYVRALRLLRHTVDSSGPSSRQSESYSKLKAVMQRLQMYPFILVIVWLFASINRVYEASTGNRVFGLFFVQRMFSSMQGMLNAFAYGYSGGVREAIREILARWFPRFFSSNSFPGSSLGSLGSGGNGYSRGAIREWPALSPKIQSPSAVVVGNPLTVKKTPNVSDAEVVISDPISIEQLPFVSSSEQQLISTLNTSMGPRVLFDDDEEDLSVTVPMSHSAVATAAVRGVVQNNSRTPKPTRTTLPGGVE